MRSGADANPRRCQKSCFSIRFSLSKGWPEEMSLQQRQRESHMHIIGLNWFKKIQILFKIPNTETTCETHEQILMFKRSNSAYLYLGTDYACVGICFCFLKLAKTPQLPQRSWWVCGRGGGCKCASREGRGTPMTLSSPAAGGDAAAQDALIGASEGGGHHGVGDSRL